MSAQPIDLDAIRERLALINGYTTPWTYQDDEENRTWVVGYTTTNPLAGLVATVPDYGEHLADLIANAPTDIAALLTEVEKSQERIAELEEDERTLRALEAAGVDNWQGYDFAMEQLGDDED